MTYPLYTAFFDASVRPPRGDATVGGVILLDGIEVIAHANYIGNATVNEAEYSALIEILEVALHMGAKRIELYGDSQVVVRQVQGYYGCNAPHLKILNTRVHDLLEKFSEWTIEYVPRAQNKRADALCRTALKNVHKYKESAA